ESAMAIAITGSGGQLGSELCRRLDERAIPLDLPDFDLTDAERVRQTLVELQPEAVINTAAYTQVDRAEEHAGLCWRINSTGVAHLTQTCRSLDIPLVHISTDYVFGSGTGRTRPYTEDDIPSPQGVYARSKLGGEQEAAAWSKHIILRTCGLYGKPGPKTPAGNFVETMLRLAGQAKPLRVVGDQHCTPSYVPHVAQALLFLLRERHFGLYHVVNQGATTWYDFAVEIFRQSGIELPVEKITTAQYGARAPRPAYSVLDTSRYHALGGYAMPTWQDALAEYLAGRA
ncbi:MAG: dTDP-4-dehydrorhamnose reductase, partial [Pirellulales bacterium]